MLIIKIGFEASPPLADLPQNRFWVFIIRIAGMKYKGAQRAPLYFIMLFFCPCDVRRLFVEDQRLQRWGAAKPELLIVGLELLKKHR